MSRPISFSFNILLVVVFIFVGACGRDASNKAPPKSDKPLEIESRPSTITIPIVASLSQLQAQLEKEIPNPLIVIDQHESACIPAKWITVCPIPKFRIKCKGLKCRKVSSGCAVKELKTKISPDVSCRIKGNVSRGPILMTGIDQKITMEMPVQIDVSAKDVGGIIKSETATGSANVRATASLDIDEDWQPSVSIDADYSWRDRIGVNILGMRITFASKVDPKVRESIDKFKAGIPSQLAALKVKEKLSEAWAGGFSSVQLSESPPAWLRFSPTAIGYSGYTVSDGAIRMSLMMEGLTETFLGSQPSKSAPTPLPNLVKDLPQEGFDFYLPVLASYSALKEEALKALRANEEQTFSVPNVGQVKVTFQDITIYQSTDGALAVGIKMKANPPKSFLATKGTIWLSAIPEIDNEKRVVGVKTFQLSADTNSTAVNLLASIISLPAINDRLKSAMRYDFNESYADALVKANNALNRELVPNVFLDCEIKDVAIDEVTATPEGFFLGLIVTGNASLRYSESNGL